MERNDVPRAVVSRICERSCAEERGCWLRALRLWTCDGGLGRSGRGAGPASMDASIPGTTGGESERWRARPMTFGCDERCRGRPASVPPGGPRGRMPLLIAAACCCIAPSGDRPGTRRNATTARGKRRPSKLARYEPTPRRRSLLKTWARSLAERQRRSMLVLGRVTDVVLGSASRHRSPVSSGVGVILEVHVWWRAF